MLCPLTLWEVEYVIILPRDMFVRVYAICGYTPVKSCARAHMCDIGDNTVLLLLVLVVVVLPGRGFVGRPPMMDRSDPFHQPSMVVPMYIIRE